jgi:hypothetical protein
VRRILEKIDRYFEGRWRIAVLDEKKGLWAVGADPSALSYLKAENARGRHILMQPLNISFYLLADDLSWSTVSRHHRHPGGAWKPGRMVVETSPANFQVWIHSARALSLAEKRFLLNQLSSDPGADPNNRFGRLPGFRNRKDKYRSSPGLYPLARLIWIDWNRKAEIPKLTLEVPQHLPQPFSHPPQGGGVCRKTSIARSDFDQGNESQTDFSYALALLRRGYAMDEVRSRILAERSDWTNHQGERRISRYLDTTISRARTIVEAS